MLRNVTLALILVFSILACSEVSEIPQPDVSDINLTSRIVRFEQVLASADTNNIAIAHEAIAMTYPAFSELYFSQLVPIYQPGISRDTFYNNFRGFLTDSRIRYLLDTVRLVHQDFDKEIVPKLLHAFKNIKYYFPRWNEPHIYTLISEYGYQHFLFEDENRVTGIGIGLDLYLGEDYPYQNIAPGNPNFSKYITRTFNKDHIVKRSVDVIFDELEGPSCGPRMLDQMIDNGKRLYILNHILPTEHDTVLMEYSADQLQWVQDNEDQIWSFFFKEELFYETEMVKINKYINPSPNSPGMPAEAPGRTGNYIGWQIIKAYMNRYPETTFAQLLAMEDAQKIMDDSRYKPRKSN